MIANPPKRLAERKRHIRRGGIDEWLKSEERPDRVLVRLVEVGVETDRP